MSERNLAMAAEIKEGVDLRRGREERGTIEDESPDGRSKDMASSETGTFDKEKVGAFALRYNQ